MNNKRGRNGPFLKAEMSKFIDGNNLRSQFHILPTTLDAFSGTI